MGARPVETTLLNIPRRFRWRVVWVLVISVSAAIVSGVLYQNWSLARDRRASPRPGQLIDVGGRKMHLYCTGRGTPVVILDSGLGDSYVAWQRVQPEIAAFVQVCS